MKADDRFVVLMGMLLNELENTSENVDVPVAAIVLDQDLNILSKGFNRREPDRKNRFCSTRINDCI